MINVTKFNLILKPPLLILFLRCIIFIRKEFVSLGIQYAALLDFASKKSIQKGGGF
jgi:hypothetical protein